VSVLVPRDTTAAAEPIATQAIAICYQSIFVGFGGVLCVLGIGAEQAAATIGDKLNGGLYLARALGLEIVENAICVDW
jgi:hypothetical protein